MPRLPQLPSFHHPNIVGPLFYLTNVVLRSSFCCDFTQRRLLVSYWHFGTVYQSHLHVPMLTPADGANTTFWNVNNYQPCVKSQKNVELTLRQKHEIKQIVSTSCWLALMGMRFGTWNVSRFYSNNMEDVYWIYLAQDRDKWRAFVLLVLWLS
jgi:hypothetical protein